MLNHACWIMEMFINKWVSYIFGNMINGPGLDFIIWIENITPDVKMVNILKRTHLYNRTTHVFHILNLSDDIFSCFFLFIVLGKCLVKETPNYRLDYFVPFHSLCLSFEEDSMRLKNLIYKNLFTSNSIKFDSILT